MSRKYPSIDAVALYKRADTKGWNAFLRKLTVTRDVDSIKRTLYGLQAGVADAAKDGLVDQDMAVWFARIQRSLEITAKNIFRALHPNPLDNPLKAKDLAADSPADYLAFSAAKKKRDNDFDQFIREASF